jgi:hypothetical protein
LSTKTIRLSLARAENKKETCYNNMLKAKERTKKSLEKLRECEATFEVSKAEVNKLRALLDDQKQLESVK